MDCLNQSGRRDARSIHKFKGNRIAHMLTYHVDPGDRLIDAEVRRLATDTIDPEFPPGGKSGETCSTRIAVDADGKVVEQAAVGEAHELSKPCMNAIGEWHFSPFPEEGEPRPRG